MKNNVLIRILSLIVVLACVFAFAGCHKDLATKEEVNNTQTSLEDAKTALNAAIDAVKNTADAAATKAALDEAVAKLDAVKATADAAATKTALEDAINALKDADKAFATNDALTAAIEELTALKDAAATKVALDKIAADLGAKDKTLEEAVAALVEADKTFATNEVFNAAINEIKAAGATKTEVDEKIATLEAEIENDIKANLTALTTKVNDLETSVNKSIEDINADIATIKTALGNIEGTEAGSLLERVVALEKTVAAIDTDAFKNEYIAVTEILLGGEDEPKSFYNFLKIINDNIDFGGYDDDSVLAYERRVEEIKFALSRAVTLEEIDKAFTDLAEAEKGLVLLVDALAAKLEEITLINLGEDCTTKIETLKGIYDKIAKKNAKIENAEDKIVIAPEVEADYVLKTGAYDTLAGFAADKGAQINGKIHPIFSVNKVLLASDATNIDAATGLIAGLVADVLGVDADYFDLYTNDVYDNLYALALEEAVAELVAGKKEAYVNAGIATKADELKAAWIEEEIAARIAADETLVPAEVRVVVEAEANTAEKLAEFTVEATNAVKADLEAEADAKAEEYTAEVMADAEAIAKTVADLEAATKVADTLYNKAEYTAVNTRYELLKLAKEDAITVDGLLDKIKTIAGAWMISRPAYNDEDIAKVVAMKNNWIADAKYKNDTDFGAFTACTSDIEIENVNFILDEDRLLTLASADKYVKDMAKVYADHKVAELVANIKAAVNGDVDVDNANIDTYIAAIADMDAAIEEVVNYKADLDTKNKTLMVSEELRERLSVINAAYDAVLAAIEVLKNSDGIKYENGEWAIENINAGKQIATYKDALAAIYQNVADDTSNDNAINSVTSTKGEEELAAVQAKFEKFAEKAIEAYNKANETINKIDDIVAANGKLTLDLGDDIFDAIDAINQAAVTGAIKGLNLNTIFTIPVVDEATGEQTMTEVQFRELYNRLYTYNNQYREMAESNGADKAEDVAADLTAAIEAIKNYNGSKLDKYNEIMAVYNRVVNEWVNVYFVNMTPAEAIAATNEVNKVGGGAYAFITNETFKTINDKYVLANKTFGEAEKAAAEWIAAANELAGSYTFHEWAEFQALEKAYNELVKKYYNDNAFNATTDPGFGLYAAHEAFKTEYDKCDTMAAEAQTKIDDIINAIKALTAIESITIDNYTAVRTDVDAVKALIAAFEAGYCANAQEDDDFIVDSVNYNVVLAKADAVVTIFEVGVNAIGTTVEGTEITEALAIDNASALKSALGYATDVETVWTVFETFKSFVVAE